MRLRGLALSAPLALSLALVAGCSSSAAPAPAPSGTIAPGFNEALGSVVNPSEEIGGDDGECDADEPWEKWIVRS